MRDGAATLSRRLFGRSLVAGAAALALFAGCATPRPSATSCTRDGVAWVGLEGDRVQALRFDSCAATLTLLAASADVAKPRWLLVHPDRAVVYAASDDAKGGRVVAFAADRDTGALTRIGDVGAGGNGTTHLALDAPSSTLLAANFGSGSTSSIALDAEGRPARLVSTVASTGSGPHRRQAGPHAHGVAIDPSGRHALVADLGADRVFVLGFDRGAQALVATDSAFMVPPGSGPHHAVFGTDGRFVYLLDELTADVTTLRWDAQAGRLTQVQSLPLSAPAFKGTRSGAEIAAGRDGRFVYVANRGENSVQVYRVDAVTGELTPVQALASGGATPWSFALHPNGRWMLVANQKGNNVALFAIDADTGMLSARGAPIELPAPLSAVFGN